MPTYEGFVTDQFIARTKKVDRAKLTERMRQIVAAPYTALNSHLLWGEWRVARGADYSVEPGRRGVLRIIYRVCEECVDLNHKEHFPEHCCEDNPVTGTKIRFLDFVNYHEPENSRKRVKPAAQYTGDTRFTPQG